MLRKYDGPMQTPPAECVEGAIGWTFISEPDPTDDRKWRVKGWRVIFSDHTTEVDAKTGLAMRATTMHAV